MYLTSPTGNLSPRNIDSNSPVIPARPPRNSQGLSTPPLPQRSKNCSGKYQDPTTKDIKCIPAKYHPDEYDNSWCQEPSVKDPPKSPHSPNITGQNSLVNMSSHAPPLPERPKTLGAGRRSPSKSPSGSRIEKAKPDDVLPEVPHEPGDGATDIHLENASSPREIPTKLDGLSVRGLGNALRLLRLSDVAAICEDNLVDGQVFLDLSEQDLTEDPFNLKGLALKKVLNIKDKGWRPKMQ